MIVERISWGGDLHPDKIAEIETAILDLDRKAHGSNQQPVLTEIQAYAKLRGFIRRHKSEAAAARSLGISRGFLSDVLNGRRPMTPAICERLGLKRFTS